MTDPVTWGNLISRSNRLGRRRWRHESNTSQVRLVKWQRHKWWLTEDPDDVLTYQCSNNTHTVSLPLPQASHDFDRMMSPHSRFAQHTQVRAINLSLLLDGVSGTLRYIPGLTWFSPDTDHYTPALTWWLHTWTGMVFTWHRSLHTCNDVVTTYLDWHGFHLTQITTHLQWRGYTPGLMWWLHT